MQRLFEAAAAALLGGQPGPDAAAAHSLLASLDWAPAMPPQTGASPSADARHRAALLRAAARFARMFQLAAPDAPGLVMFGAEIEPARQADWWTGPRAGVSGTGLTRQQAFAACVGEGVEFHSQFEMPEDRPGFARLGIAAATASGAMIPPGLQPAGVLPDRELDWTRATRLSDGREVLVPADLCYRRAPPAQVIAPPAPLSIGCAAAQSREAAALHGLLELVERDAAALWWRGGRRGHLLDLECAAQRDALALIARLRAGAAGRRSWVLDIATDLSVPCVAAVSVARDGRGFSCGTAARTTLAGAVHAAVLELCQMELAHDVVQAKRRERGDAALNATDRRHVARFAGIDAGACALLHPLPPRDPPPDLDGDAAGALGRLTERLAARGMEPVLLDLTRGAFGIPVLRMMCPGLEQEPSELIGSRLREAISATGGGRRYTGGIALM